MGSVCAQLIQPCVGFAQGGAALHGIGVPRRGKVVQATRRLVARHAAWVDDLISFAEFDASVQGWINHVGHADTWGLRRHVLGRLPLDGKPLR